MLPHLVLLFPCIWLVLFVFVFVFLWSLGVKFMSPCLYGKHLADHCLPSPTPFVVGSNLTSVRSKRLIQMVSWIFHLSAIGQNAKWAGEISTPAPVIGGHFSE